MQIVSYPTVKTTPAIDHIFLIEGIVNHLSKPRDQKQQKDESSRNVLHHIERYIVKV
jgi:hypothetical protein